MKDGRKGDCWRQKLKGAGGQSLCVALRSLCHDKAEDRGSQSVTLSSDQSPPKRSGWGVWMLKFYASHFPLLALRVPGRFHQSAFCGHFSCWERWSNQTGGRGGGGKGRPLPWRLSLMERVLDQSSMPFIFCGSLSIMFAGRISELRENAFI